VDRGAVGGRRDDELEVVIADQAGTASRPPRVQGIEASGVEVMDHIADGVLSAATSAIAGTGVPDDEARIIVARRTRIELPLPRRTIWVSRWPSASLSRLALTGSATRTHSLVPTCCRHRE